MLRRRCLPAWFATTLLSACLLPSRPFVGAKESASNHDDGFFTTQKIALEEWQPQETASDGSTTTDVEMHPDLSKLTAQNLTALFHSIPINRRDVLAWMTPSDVWSDSETRRDRLAKKSAALMRKWEGGQFPSSTDPRILRALNNAIATFQKYEAL